jgi:carbamoyltransferase
MDIAAALQAALESSLLHVLRHFKRETGQRNLCMAGGVALNCTANSTIWRSRMFERMFVQPAAGDDGSALGAALYTRRLHEPTADFARMSVPLWGPSFDARTVGELVGQQTDCESIYFERFEELAAEAAKRLAEGQILGWFQGRMEFGPRALGNRSILADPRDSAMRDRINRLVKKREGFRPFAPAVTVEAASRFFEMSPGDEPLYAHMLFVTRVCPAYRYVLPAVTHIDGSARVQTVSQQDNWRFWKLLREFENVSGLPILLNTSFNVRGQPIVCTPAESIQTFLAAGLDGMAIEDYLVLRKRPVADLDGGPE